MSQEYSSQSQPSQGRAPGEPQQGKAIGEGKDEIAGRQQSGIYRGPLGGVGFEAGQDVEPGLGGGVGGQRQGIGAGDVGRMPTGDIGGGGVGVASGDISSRGGGIVGGPRDLGPQGESGSSQKDFQGLSSQESLSQRGSQQQGSQRGGQGNVASPDVLSQGSQSGKPKEEQRSQGLQQASGSQQATR